MDELYSAASKESEIDTLLDLLIAKIMSGAANHQERVEFDELVASRTRLMRPRPMRSDQPLRRTA
jgi:hypothetical protein